MPVLEVPGARLNYRTAGEGSPLVLVHGSATDMTTWDGVVDELAREHLVVVYDRRGYGQSRHKPVRDHRIHAQDLTAVLREVAGPPATVVGWSSGGNIALAVAVKHPELFSALVVVEAPFHGMRHADRHVLGTALQLKLTQLRGRRLEAAGSSTDSAPLCAPEATATISPLRTSAATCKPTPSQCWRNGIRTPSG